MKIAMVSTPYILTPPIKYGGAERVVSMLTEKLVQNGHDVTLFAIEGSKTSAELVKIWSQPEGQMNHLNLIRLLYKDIQKHGDFDIIHNHNYYAYDHLVKKEHLPIVTTMHVEAKNYSIESAKNSKYICISKRQAILAKEIGFNVTKVIYNPTNTDLYTFYPNHGNELVFLGSIAPIKGTHIAIEAAEKTGLKLLIAGPVFDNEYYESLIEPKLKNKNIEYVGEVNHSEKVELFSNALALLFPTQCEEPFGLVMTEAMACGVPVIGFNIGAVPEIIKEGKTGFVVNDISEMIKSVDKVYSINCNSCRKRVEENFSIDKITIDYEKLYCELANE